MEKDTEKTVVIFRKFRDYEKDVIAIFPEELGSYKYTCNSYLHIGQHGSVDANDISFFTDLATEEEYSDLKKELENIGYNLIVRRKITRKMHEKRFKKNEEFYKRS